MHMLDALASEQPDNLIGHLALVSSFPCPSPDRGGEFSSQRCSSNANQSLQTQHNNHFLYCILTGHYPPVLVTPGLSTGN